MDQRPINYTCSEKDTDNIAIGTGFPGISVRIDWITGLFWMSERYHCAVLELRA